MRVSFQDLIESYGVFVAPEEHHHSRNGWLQFDCPHCSPGSGRFRMGYSTERGSLNCWVCGRHGAWDTLQALGVPTGAIKEFMSNRTFKAPKQTQHHGHFKQPSSVVDLKPKHIAWLRGRNLNPDAMVKLWGLRAIAQCVRLPWRLWVPIHVQNKPVSWTTRSVKHKKHMMGEPRWLSASAEEESTPAGQLIYGMDYVRHAAIICEGPSDVWAVGAGAVGMLGVATTDAQVAQLAKIPVRVVCYDSSEEAQQRAKVLCETLSLFPGSTTNVELDASDPGEACAGELQDLRKTFLHD